MRSRSASERSRSSFCARRNCARSSSSRSSSMRADVDLADARQLLAQHVQARQARRRLLLADQLVGGCSASSVAYFSRMLCARCSVRSRFSASATSHCVHCVAHASSRPHHGGTLIVRGDAPRAQSRRARAPLRSPPQRADAGVPSVGGVRSRVAATLVCRLRALVVRSCRSRRSMASHARRQLVQLRRTASQRRHGGFLVLAALGDAHLNAGHITGEGLDARHGESRRRSWRSAQRSHSSDSRSAATAASSSADAAARPRRSRSSAAAVVDFEPRHFQPIAASAGVPTSKRSRSFSAATSSSVSACASRRGP